MIKLDNNELKAIETNKQYTRYIIYRQHSDEFNVGDIYDNVKVLSIFKKTSSVISVDPNDIDGESVIISCYSDEDMDNMMAIEIEII